MAVLRSCLLIVALFAAIGCASLGPQYSGETAALKGQALVTLYRPARFAGSAGSPYVSIDKNRVGEIPNNAYLPLNLDPGTHEIALSDMFGGVLTSFHFDVKAGQSYFIRYDSSMANNAKESAQNTMVAGGVGGGAAGAAAGAIFYASGAEAKAMMTNLDTRAQKKSENPGFMVVKPEFAKTEIVKTRLYQVKK